MLRTPQALVDDTAQVFLGTRIQCAQCHHHPYEKWSQDDYWGLAAFFARVQLVNPKNTVPAKKANTKASATTLRVVLMPARPGHRSAWQELREAAPTRWQGARPPRNGRSARTSWWTGWCGRTTRSSPGPSPTATGRISSAVASWTCPTTCASAIRPATRHCSTPSPRISSTHKFDLKHLIRTICTSKTYQLSSTPNEHNRKDKQNFARFYPRRLPAEVLFDAFDQVTGVPVKFVRKGGGAAKTAATRAIELPDEAVKTPLLMAFGKPDRSSACECETERRRHADAKPVSDRLNGIARQTARTRAAASPSWRPTLGRLPDKIKEIYLWVYARPPDGRGAANGPEHYLTPAGIARKRMRMCSGRC